MVRGKRKTEKAVGVSDTEEEIVKEETQKVPEIEKRKRIEERAKFDYFVKQVFDEIRNIGIAASVLFAGLYVLHNPSSINKVIGGEVKGVPPHYYFMSIGVAWIAIVGGVCLLILCFHHVIVSIGPVDSHAERAMSRKEFFMRLFVVWFFYLPVLLAILVVALRGIV